MQFKNNSRISIHLTQRLFLCNLTLLQKIYSRWSDSKTRSHQHQGHLSWPEEGSRPGLHKPHLPHPGLVEGVHSIVLIMDVIIKLLTIFIKSPIKNACQDTNTRLLINWTAVSLLKFHGLSNDHNFSLTCWGFGRFDRKKGTFISRSGKDLVNYWQMLIVNWMTTTPS